MRVGIYKLKNLLYKEHEFSPRYNLILSKINETVRKKWSLEYNNIIKDNTYDLFKISELLEKLYFTISANNWR